MYYYLSKPSPNHFLEHLFKQVGPFLTWANVEASYSPGESPQNGTYTCYNQHFQPEAVTNDVCKNVMEGLPPTLKQVLK